jgi:hypothetical protein
MSADFLETVEIFLTYFECNKIHIIIGNKMQFSKQNFVLDYLSLRQKLKKLPIFVLIIGLVGILSVSLLTIESKTSLFTSQLNSILDDGQSQDTLELLHNVYELEALNSSQIPPVGDHISREIGPKPIMHTFWQSVPGGCCGADENGHQQLIDAWENAWHDNGWETAILTMDDAKKHPYFETLTRLFVGTNISEYDKRCFERWLAMAMLPTGGWMSDYDVFPLDFSAEESYALVEKNGKGRFTSYAHVAPALNYASHDEWERLVELMMNEIHLFEGDFLSDMYVFRELVKKDLNKVGLVYGPDIFVSRKGFENYNNGILDCDSLKNQKAIHFSHHSTQVSFDEGDFPITDGSPIQNRGLAAALFMHDYKKQCL